MQEKKMTKKETEFRNAINEELVRLGYHPKVAFVRLAADSSMYEFVPPVDKWFEELRFVDQFVTQKLKDWQHRADRFQN
jgi:hypothetical protein